MESYDHVWGQSIHQKFVSRQSLRRLPFAFVAPEPNPDIGDIEIADGSGAADHYCSVTHSRLVPSRLLIIINKSHKMNNILIDSLLFLVSHGVTFMEGS
jgi:hypothetical protein